MQKKTMVISVATLTLILVAVGGLMLIRRVGIFSGSAADEALEAGVRDFPRLAAVAADSDGDGLTDEEEVALKTDPFKADTDKDGLTDREEVKVYHSDPLKDDSLAAGVPDGQEIKKSLDFQAAADKLNGR